MQAYCFGVPFFDIIIRGTWRVDCLNAVWEHLRTGNGWVLIVLFPGNYDQINRGRSRVMDEHHTIQESILSDWGSMPGAFVLPTLVAKNETFQ